MRIAPSAALAAGLLLANAARAQEPRAAEERVVLHTVAGDIVLALYPDVAPRHVEQILKLVRLGVYDTSDFFSIVPGFYAEVSVRGERTAELSPDQEKAIHPLKAEFSKLHHVYGSLSMARDERDPNTAETAFSIILTDWPDGDGRYTIFGRVESGMDVVEEFLKVPRDDEGRPVARLGILKAEVVSRTALAKMRLAPAQPVQLPQELTALTKERETITKLKAVAGGIALMILIGIATFAFAPRFPQASPSLVLLNVLIGFFLLLVILTPMAHLHAALAAFLFLGLLGTLKLMSRFESPT